MIGVERNYYLIILWCALQKKILLQVKLFCVFFSILILDASLLLCSRPLSLQSTSVSPSPFCPFQFTSKPTTATDCTADRWVVFLSLILSAQVLLFFILLYFSLTIKILPHSVYQGSQICTYIWIFKPVM